MGRTFIRQDDQILSSSAYSDSFAAGIGLVTGSSVESGSLQHDLNSLRSQIKRIHGQTNWYDSLLSRSLGTVDGDLNTMETRPRLFRAENFSDILVSASLNYVVLGATTETPTEVAAVGAVTTQGAVAASGSIGSHGLEEVSGLSALRPKNLVLIRSASTGETLQTSGGTDIYGLLQTEALDGVAFDNTTSRVQISFVHENVTRDDLVTVPVADIAGNSIHYSYVRRNNLRSVPEEAYLPGVFVDVPVPFTGSQAVTLDNAIDNQSGPATQDQDIEVRITDELNWKWTDSTGASDILVVSASAGGDSVLVNGGLFQATVTDFDINNTNDADFLNGATFDSGGTSINVGVTAGQIDAAGLVLNATGGGDLLLSASDDISFVDVAKVGSTYDTPFLLSSASAHWNSFETNFGEVSLLEALNSLALQTSSSARLKYVAAVDVTNINPNVNVNDAAGLDANLGDYTGKQFTSDLNIFLNGVLLRNGADASANHDVYPGDTASTGDLKFEFKLKKNDVVTMEIF